MVRIYGTEERYGFRFADVRLAFPHAAAELDCKGALPVMYLLDAEGRVVLKEPAVATVLSRYSNGLR